MGTKSMCLVELIGCHMKIIIWTPQDMSNTAGTL